MITNALRALWAEPRAAGAPERGWRDWVLVSVLVVAALLEGVLREDVAWRPIAMILAVGLAAVLLWRRTRPLACVVVGFGTAMVLGLATLAGGAPMSVWTRWSTSSWCSSMRWSAGAQGARS